MDCTYGVTAHRKEKYMLVVVSFTYYSDIVYIPDSLGHTPEELQNLFDNWLYDKTIDHEYWIYENGKKYGVTYDIDAFIKWLKKNIFADIEDKVRIVEKDISEIPRDLERLYF